MVDDSRDQPAPGDAGGTRSERIVVDIDPWSFVALALAGGVACYLVLRRRFGLAQRDRVPPLHRLNGAQLYESSLIKLSPGAAWVLRLPGTLERALKAGKFPVQADDLRLYRRIATMDSAAPLPPLPDQTPTWTSAAHLARAWDLNPLAERLAARAEAAT